MSKCPAIDEEGVVYLSAPDQKVHALNGETGEVLWSYPTEPGVSTAPVLGPDGTVYVGLSNSNIVALDGSTGELLRQTPSGRVVTVLALSDGGTLFGHGGYGYVLALDAANGERSWETELGPFQPSAGLALEPVGNVLFSTRGRIMELEGGTGSVLHEYLMDGSIPGELSPVLGADGTVYSGSWTSGFHALDTMSQTPRWQYTTGLAYRSDFPAAVGPDGTVYVTCGKLLAINTVTGRTRWFFQTEQQIELSPAVAADGTILVVSSGESTEGNLYAVDASTGQEKWRFNRSMSLSSPPTIGPGGVVYVASEDGNLYAVQGSAPLADSPWPKWQQNAANTGQSRWAEGPVGILGQGGNEPAVEGSTVRLWVNAKGSPPFEYQWYRDGEAIPEATENHLVVSNVGFEDEASYHAVVSNSLGTATTELMSLKVGFSLAVHWYPVLGTVTGVPEAAVLLPGTEVTLEAQGAEGHAFLRWEGDLESDDNPLTLRMERNLRLRARFAVEPGTLLWTCDTGWLMRTAAAIGSDGTVYVGADDTLLAVDGDSGHLKWEMDRSWWWARPPSPVVGASGLVYAADHSRVVALEPGTAQVTWSAGPAASSAYFPTPVTLALDGTVYQSAEYRTLRALNGLTGETLWETKTAGDASSAAVGVDGTLHVSTYENQTQAFDPLDGREKWRTPTEGSGYYAPALDGVGNLFAVATSLGLARVDAATGERLWSTLRVSSLGAAVLGLDHTVLVQSGTGIFCLDQADGSVRWSVPEGKGSGSVPAVASDGTVYVGTGDGKLMAVNGGAGEVLWTYQTGAWIGSSPSIGLDKGQPRVV